MTNDESVACSDGLAQVETDEGDGNQSTDIEIEKETNLGLQAKLLTTHSQPLSPQVTSPQGINGFFGAN